MEELKPCPFCGKSVAVLSNAQEELEVCNNYVMVVCAFNRGGCGAATGFYNSEQEAIEHWNRRADNGRGKEKGA